MRRSVLISFALLATLVVPSQAFALDQPDVVNDPPAAFDNSTTATVDLNDVPAAANAAAPAVRAKRARARDTSPAHATLRGELPFTGPTTDTIAAVLLGIVLILAGLALRAIPTTKRRDSAA